MMEFTENICQFLKGKSSSIALKIGDMMFRNFANYPRKCPIEPVRLLIFHMLKTFSLVLFFSFIQFKIEVLKVDYEKMGTRYLPSMFLNGRYHYLVKFIDQDRTFVLSRMEILINAIGIINND